MEKHKCPRCDWESWGAFRRGRNLFRFNAGDIIGCRNCGAILIVNKDLSHREPSKKEFKQMRSDPETWANVVRTMADILKFLKRELSKGGGR